MKNPFANTSEPFDLISTVKGGFPVRLRGKIYPAEPEVGIPCRYIGELEVLTLSGRNASFLNLTEAHEQTLCEEIFRQTNNPDFNF